MTSPADRETPEGVSLINKKKKSECCDNDLRCSKYTEVEVTSRYPRLGTAVGWLGSLCSGGQH